VRTPSEDVVLGALVIVLGTVDVVETGVDDVIADGTDVERSEDVDEVSDEVRLAVQYNGTRLDTRMVPETTT
jgi:hypothetical protein